MPWAVTSYMQESLITVSGTVRTTTNVIVPASPIPSAITTVTKTSSDTGVHLTKVEILLPSTAPIATITPAPSNQSALSTYYYVPVTYTPPAKCNATWEFIKPCAMEVPDEVTSQLTPWSTITSSTSYTYSWTSSVDATTEIDAILYPTDIADHVYYFASLFNMPEPIRHCTQPTTRQGLPTITFPPGPSRVQIVKPTTGVSEYAYCEDGDYWIWGGTAGKWPLTRRQTAIVAIFSFIYLLFIIVGVWENVNNFKSLMRGQKAHLGLPHKWVMPTLGLIYIFLGPSWEARTEDDQCILWTRWKEMPKGEKIRLYFQYAWRWTYPPILGAEPYCIWGGLVFRKALVKKRESERLIATSVEPTKEASDDHIIL
ncbi:hypothetical protein DL95DRAFT_491817 [Leptodontidium sp. 2 PMI_412]|nr:hypothetical protein DL95DRAFT_491817 [Leptodontidium sp. 2 PMI_412]